MPEVAGDLPAALIILYDGSKIRESDVFDMVAEHFVDSYKLRGGIYFVKALPMTPSGKILRIKARELAFEFNKNK